MTAASLMPARRDPGVAYRELLVRAWRPRAWTLIFSDALTAALAALLAALWRVGGDDASWLRGIPTLLTTAAVVPLWLLGLWVCGAYSRRLLAEDTELRGRVLRTAARTTVLVAVASVLIDSTALLRHDLLAVTLAAALTPVMRRLYARLDELARSVPHGPRRVLIVGHAGSIAEFLLHQRPADARRLSVVAACVVGARSDADEQDELPVPVVGGMDEIVLAAGAYGCDIVIALGCPEFGRGTLRRLCWRLHQAGVEVALAPILSDVSAARLALATAGGLPLLHLRAPVLRGPVRRLADLCQRAAAALILLLLSPLLLTLAVLVRATSRGPALFRQTRVGRDGAEFTCLKFRTMVADAEARQAEVAHLNEMRDGPLFKISKDPRLTRIGGALRRYSLDELPQLLNVLGGSMALVGPRPPLPAEVARYSEDMRRRLAVKPGLTGLWQVSGRSSLSWAESVRLDLNYVENWSPGLDAMILLRTTSAVVRGEGAY
ncbi:MAG TPA: exopolysaccharide biosynthesis polyprenyl glycosylphosphotransferase [Actinospica sp.]|nr:exopolysaccharide biosynthesis polyprenyl glycosylphosphotransferase [Actinospica sp.]